MFCKYKYMFNSFFKVADLQSNMKNFFLLLFFRFFHLYLEQYVVLILSEKTIKNIVYHIY